MNTLLTLLHISDSSYPTGAFGHSWGLEAAIMKGLVTCFDELYQWGLTSLEHSLIPLDGRAIRLGHRSAMNGDVEEVIRLERELVLYRPSKSVRCAQGQVGRSFIEVTSETYGLPMVTELKEMVHPGKWEDFIQYPLAWAVASAELDITEEDALQAFLQGAVRQMAQVAVRLIPLGQREANQFIACLSKEILNMDLELKDQDFMSLCPGLDIMSLAHETLQARYFRS